MSGAASRLAASFRRFWPERPAPVGMRRVSAVPAGVEVVSTPLASACALWRIGTERVVAAGAGHGACAIGLLTQGFADTLPGDDASIAAMLEVAYIDPAEVAGIPRLPRGHAAIVYGPLADLPVEPEAALVFAAPLQAMLLGEALGLMRAGAGGLPMTGRPTCMAIPAALETSTSRGSLACTGARVYAGMGADELLVVIPASALDGLSEELARIVAANAAVEALANANLVALGAG